MMKINKYLGLVLVLGLSQCRPAGKTEDKQPDAKQPYCLSAAMKQQTDIVEIKEREMIEQINLPGRVAYNENDLVVFKSLLTGVIESVNFELGDQVRKGQVLAQVKSVEIQGLQQQRKYQQNQLQLLEKQLASKKDLLNDGMAAQTEVLELENERDAAQLELDRVNQTLGLYRAGEQGTFQLLAPKDGFIIQKAMSPGQVISADSEALFSISNLKQVWVMVNIFASNLQYTHVGDPVKVKSIAFPDQTYSGRIDKISNVFDADDHVMKARVILDNPNLKLLPGLSVDILLEKKTASAQTAWAIPNKAVLFHNNQHYVVLYNGDCELSWKQVDPIYRNEEFSFVAEGFEKQQRVVASNALMIFEEIKGR